MSIYVALWKRTEGISTSPFPILIAKLHRYEDKYLEAFQKVYERTGFPSPEALLAELRASPRLFARQDRSLEHMPNQYPESKISESVPHLFWALWRKRISVQNDILAITYQEIALSYCDHDDSHKTSLADIASISARGRKRPEKKRMRNLPVMNGAPLLVRLRGGTAHGSKLSMRTYCPPRDNWLPEYAESSPNLLGSWFKKEQVGFFLVESPTDNFTLIVDSKGS